MVRPCPRRCATRYDEDERSLRGAAGSLRGAVGAILPPDDTNYGGTSDVGGEESLAEAFQKRFFYGPQKRFRKEDHSADHVEHEKADHPTTQNDEDLHQQPEKISEMRYDEEYGHAEKRYDEEYGHAKKYQIHAQKQHDEEYGHPLKPHPHVTAAAAAKYKKLYLEWHKTAGTRAQELDAVQDAFRRAREDLRGVLEEWLPSAPELPDLKRDKPKTSGTYRDRRLARCLVRTYAPYGKPQLPLSVITTAVQNPT